MVIHGRCHCGNLAFELTWEPAPQQIQARACTCTFCVKHGGVWTSNPHARLRISVDDRASMNVYSFGTRTAEFCICSRCGVVPLVTSNIDGAIYAVVNVNTFANVATSLVQRMPMTFDDEAVESRLARRKRNWIADVQFLSA